MPDQEPIRPEQIPDHLVELYRIAFTGRATPAPATPEQATRAGLAAVLTEATERIAQAVEAERIAQAVEAELTDDLGDMLVVTIEGQRAAAVIRSYPEAFDD